MVCLIKSKYKAELAEYERILGSEEAAYYALAANNGYTLDLDPYGEPSKLYEALLSVNNGDKNAAIVAKMSVYMPQFMQEYGNWVTENEPEPSIADINGAEFISSSESISEIIEDKQLEKSLTQLQKENDFFTRNALIEHYISKARNSFVEEQVAKYMSKRTNPSPVDLYGVRLGSQIDWDENKIKEIIGEQQQKLAKIFRLKKVKRNDGTFVYISDDKSKDSKLRVSFVNSITGQDWTDDEGVVHRGLFHENSKSEEAAWNAIYLSIENGDSTTFVHEMVHYYIRTFWDSDVVQSALYEVSLNHSNVNKTEKEFNIELEESLVDIITEATMSDYEQRANRNFILKFWDGINDILHNVIGSHIAEDKYIKDNALDTLTAAFSINQDLSDRRQEIISFQKFIIPMYQDSMNPLQNEPSELEGTTFWKIKSTLEARQKSERSRGKANNKDLLNVEYYLQRIQRRSITDKNDIDNTVSDFMLLAQQDIERAIRVLAEIKLGGQDAIRDLDAGEFMHLKYDIIAYYDKMLEDVIGNYINNNDNLSQQQVDLLKQQKYRLHSIIGTLKTSFNEILGGYVDYQIERYADELVVMGDKDRFIANMKLWARNSIDNGDLLPFENSLGPASISKSPIVRLVEYIVTAQNRITHTVSLERGHELADKYKKCASIGKKIMSVNFMKQFCELDDDGNPTGYFVRKYNYGKLYKIRDNVIKKLVKKYDLQYDENTGQINFKNKNQYVQYITDFYNQMDGIANFRYKKEYYIERAKILSPEAIELERQIQKQINTLLNKAYDKELDMPLIFNLTSGEIKQLDELRKEKRNLSNPYVIEFDENGNISSFSEKQGQALEIAKQFMQWKMFKSQHFKYKSNWNKFNNVRDEIVRRYGEDSQQVKLFDYKYKHRVISDEFYKSLAPNESNSELTELYRRKSAILNSIMAKSGQYMPNLKKLNKQAFEELKRIDLLISDIIGDRQKKTQAEIEHEQMLGYESFNDIASKEWVLEYDSNGKLTTNPVYNYFLQLERVQRLAAGIPQDQESLYTYVDNRGYTTPLSIFKYTKPKGDGMIEESLLEEFSEIDEEHSILINTEFDVNENEEMQPKNKNKFKNKNWEKIQNNSKLRDFYDAILQTMYEAYSLLPNMDPEKMKYVMPQMRDRDAKLIFRNRHILNNIGASVADAFNITERDTRYNEDFSQRPDGSYVETIPIRWVTRLKDPTIISTDILASVTMFYEMANNYKNKADINPLLQTILFQTQGGFTPQTPGIDTSKQAKRIQKYLQMYVYGRTRTGLLDSNKPMSLAERRASRITDVVLSKAHAKLMNHNWRSVLKNFVDSFLTETGEILAGKYITVKDAMLGNMAMAKEVMSQTASFGRANTKSKIAALMQLNGVSGTISDIFSQHNETWLRRVLSKHFSMGEYTFIDYTFKGHFTASLYHSIRLVMNPNTKKLEFMTKDQAMYHYHAAGLKMKDGLKAWKKSKQYLFDAYDVDDKGNAVVKPEFNEYVYPYIESLGRTTNRLVNQVAGTIRERTAVISGILDQSGSASAKQSTIGAMILQMRGWMITQMWDNFKDGNDFAEYQQQWRNMFQAQNDQYATVYTSGSNRNTGNKNPLKYVIVDEDPELHGQYNFETGSIETGQWRGLKTASMNALSDLLYRLRNAHKHIRRIEDSEEYKRKLTRNERYKLRRLSTMTATFVIIAGCTYLTTLAAIKWPEKWYLHLLQAVNISVISERASQLPIFAPFAILDIVNTIIISKTLIQDADKFVDLIGDILEASGFYEAIGYTPEHSYKEEIKSGAYKGRQRWERDFFKVTSYTNMNVDNVFRSMSESGNDASINYYIHNVSPTKQVYGAAQIFGDEVFDAFGLEKPKKDKKEKKSSNKVKRVAF